MKAALMKSDILVTVWRIINFNIYYITVEYNSDFVGCQSVGNTVGFEGDQIE